MNHLDNAAYPPGSFFHSAQAYPNQQQLHGGVGGNAVSGGVVGGAIGVGLGGRGGNVAQGQQHAFQLQSQALQQHRVDGNGMSTVQPIGSYTTAPYSQSITTTIPQQQQQQQQQSRNSASPHQPNSPFVAGTQQQQIKYPMAAPPLPLTPSHQASTSTPQSPVPSEMEKERVKLLMEINLDLLEEVSKMQAEGQGGATNPQQQALLKQHNMDDKMASEEYIQTMRRVQANLGYLAPNIPGITQQQKAAVPGPAHMTPPPHMMEQLQGKYARLSELFPGWKGFDRGGKPQQTTPQQQAALNASRNTNLMNGIMS